MRLLLTLLTFTICNLFGQTFLINEDFQTGFPGSMKNIQNDTGIVHSSLIMDYTEAWNIQENPDSTGDSIIASTSYYENNVVASRWLITPQVQLGTYGNYLEWDAKSHDPSFPDGYHVLVSTTNDSLHNFTDTLFFTDFELPNWTSREVQFVDSVYSGAQVYVAFVHDSEDQFILYLDNIRLRADDPLSIDEHQKEVISTIYPNPFESNIFIRSEYEIKSVWINDLSGRTIKTLEGDIRELANLDLLNSGSYFLTIHYKNGLFETRKLIKK